ncbi:hypothetical protein BCR33DRAFT_769038 [Rhizoclosmatium globosum]|uniref:Uncharacterized protein n=1 Tax=Rhizoclosmatium globosum TaxID=329046 RepID=A0A1Y2BWL9_9FUNG|nr:hypothetical protein BCR33DRAFT_769038 [Rhizoclosmatium globosum]|eukprot:ORY38515.1 hypothetical protein BCR33DRAFT_769038 [Rhizoclosmatium globosum]
MEVLKRLDEGVQLNLEEWKQSSKWREGQDLDSMWAVKELTWGNIDAQDRVSNRLKGMTTSETSKFDIIVASEILYLAHEHKNLAKTIKAFCHPDTIIYMVYKRRGLGEEGFYRMASWAGLECRDIPRDSLDAEFIDDLDHIVMELKPIRK